MLIGLSRVSCLALSKARVRQRLRRPRPAAAILHLRQIRSQPRRARARPRKTASLINRRANDLAVPIGSLTYIGTGRRPRSDSLRRSRHPIAFLTVDCPKVVYELTYALRDILVERIDGRYAAFRRYEIIESSHKSACRKIVAYFPQRAPLQPEPFQRPLVQQISIIAVEWSVDLNVYCSTFVHELPWAALSIHIKSKTFVSRQVARRLWNTVPGKVGWRTGNDTTTACKANRYTVRFRHAADADREIVPIACQSNQLIRQMEGYLNMRMLFQKPRCVNGDMLASERSWRGHYQTAGNMIVAVDDAVFHLVQFGQYSSALLNVLPPILSQCQATCRSMQQFDA